MPSERVQRRIDKLLDQAEQAADQRKWKRVSELAWEVQQLDPDNGDARTFVQLAERALAQPDPGIDRPSSPPLAPATLAAENAAAEASQPRLPTSFASGRYVVKKFLGEGGKKKVFLAHDTTLDRDVAFALIKTEGLDDAARERVVREAQAMGRLGDHPNIVPIFDLGTERDQPYMVLPLMAGGDVEGLIEKSAAASPPGLPLDRALQIAKDVCEGLTFAHSEGIVHRDLKPGNVWLTDRGAARIGDFGLAVATDRSRLTREGFMVGTVAYMPPEQAMGGDITPRADLYALGAMLYEMVTGRPPFLGDDDIAIIGQHINTPPVAPGWHNPQCPKPLEALIMRLLAKDPAQRPESAADVLSALTAMDVSASRPEGARGRREGLTGESAKEVEPRSLDSMSGGVFVGRQKEMDQLRAGLEDALSGRGRMMTLVGEPGIGKTRTSLELATYAGVRNCQVLWGRCYEGTGAPPYWPWVQAIRSYVHTKEPAELKREMGSTASVIAEVIPDVKERLPDVQPPQWLDDPDAARFRLFDSITTFLKNASRTRPILLIVDDLHWSDKPSLMLLEFFVRELTSSRILLIGTYRDVELNRRHPLAITLGDLTKGRLFERVLLRGLQTEDVARFIEIAAGVKPPSALVDTVFRHTEGNPLFVTETVRLLVQEGELHRRRGERDGRGRRTTSWDVRIPQGVREVIGRRLDRLSERCNEVLTTAAVIGRQFRLDVLKKLIEDLTEDRLLDVLDEALAARIIEELPTEIGLYQFTHALLQETLTSELSLTRKVRLHARIAEALEAAYGDRAVARAAELAFHFDQAQTVHGPEKLVRYSLLAGQQALAAYGFEEAERHFKRGLQAKEGQPDDLETAELLYGLGQSLVQTLGRFEMQRAFDTLVQAFDLYLQLGENEKAVAVAATPFPNIQGFSGRARLIERAVELVRPESREHASLLAGIAMAARYELFDDDLSRSTAAESVRIAKNLGEPSIELKARLVQIARRPGEIDVGDDPEAMQRAGELLRDIRDPATEAMYHEAVSMRHHRAGERDLATQSLEAAMAAAERSGNRWLTGAILSDVGVMAVSEGDWNHARQLIERGLTFSPGEVRLLGPLCRIEFELGNFDRGLELLEPLLGVFSPRNRAIIGAVASASGLVGRDLCPQHIFDAAWSFFFADERPLGFRRLTGKNLAELLMVRHDLPRLGQVIQRLREIWDVRALAQMALSSRPSSDGAAAAALGDYKWAEHVFDAVETAKWLSVPDRAWLYSDRAEALLARDEPGDRERAVKLLDDALKITQRLGMKPLTERILARKQILKA